VDPSAFKTTSVITTPQSADKKKKKVGPNEECPCGSKKKYKKCCMNKA